MQAFQVRCLILAVVLAAGGLLVGLGDPGAAREARLPPVNDTALLSAEGWSVVGATTESYHGVSFAHWILSNRLGTTADLTISTSSEAKRIFKSGPDIPFRGSGYEVETDGSGLLPPGSDWDAMLVRRGSDERVVLYAYGERRGFLGRGLRGWASALVDAIRGKGNDYYMIAIVVPLNGTSKGANATEVARFADAVFPRIAAWYAGDGHVPDSNSAVGSSPRE
jgi:hypothetical protein